MLYIRHAWYNMNRFQHRFEFLIRLRIPRPVVKQLMYKILSQMNICREKLPIYVSNSLE